MGSLLLAMTLWLLQVDRSVKSLEQMPHATISTVGEEDTLDRLNLSRLKLIASLSKDHLSLFDQLSEEPPWDPMFDLLVHPGWCIKGEPSSDIEKFGDIMPRIRLSDTWRSRWWWPGERRDHLDGVKLDMGMSWLWEEDKGDAADKDEIECAGVNMLVGDSSIATGVWVPLGSFAFKEMRSL